MRPYCLCIKALCCRTAIGFLLVPALLGAKSAFAGENKTEERKAALKAAAKEIKATGE